MKRDTWTSKFSEVVFALGFPRGKRNYAQLCLRRNASLGGSVYIPDANLRTAITESLIEYGVRQTQPNQSGAAVSAITAEEMATLTLLGRYRMKGIQDMTGLEFAIESWKFLEIEHNLISDTVAYSQD